MFNTRKKNLKNLVLVILLISLVLFVVACGGDEPEVVLATVTPIPTESSSAPQDAQKVQDTEDAKDVEGVDVHLEAAAGFFAAEEYDKAVVELKKVIELAPDNTDVYTNLALAYFKSGDYENAAATWSDVIELASDEPGPYYERGMSYFNLKKYTKAIDDFTRNVDLDPDNADAYRMRGKSHAFMEEYEQAVADFSQTVELDPASDEAYFNRAVSMSKIGKTKEDMMGIVADYGMVLQISENPELRGQAQNTLETLLGNTDDPDLRQLATDALQGKVASAGAPNAASDASAAAEPSIMDLDINRAPGHSIGFEDSLEPGEAHRFLLLASPGDTIGAGASSDSGVAVGIQNINTGQVLSVALNDESLFVTISEGGLYHIIIEDTSGQGGDYVASFEASPKVSFALDPNFFIIGRLPEGSLLSYTYTAPGGSTLIGNVIPHPDTPVDLVVKILNVENQAVLFEGNNSGPGENEQFIFTTPADGGNELLTYIVSVEDVDQNKGGYILAIDSDAQVEIVAPAASFENSPEAVVQAVFDAAKSGDFAALKDLCDPQGENDGDTQMICDIATDDTNQKEFVEYFAAGKINGNANISGDGTQAEVPFLFGPDGDSEEIMGLINRGGQWYLFGF